MKLFKKSTLSLALTAAMIGGVAMTQQATAMPAASAGDAQPAVAAGAPYVNQNGLGQALIFPYYTVRSGFKSFFNITNTGDDALAVKVRFHEGQNSRDALDFNLVLSPQDVWTGWIEDSASGPVVKTVDNSCVVGAPSIKGSGQPLSNVAYGDIISAFEDQGPNDINRTREGYVEAIVMGKASDGRNDNGSSTAGLAMYNASLHNALGNPANCSYVDDQFVATGPTTLPVAFPFADAGANGDGDAPAVAAFEALGAGDNPLKGNFSIIDATTGRGAGNAAVAIADFMNPAALGATTFGTASTPGTNLVTAQNFPYFLEPSLASRDGIWSDTGLGLVEAALMSTSIINEWANNPETGAAVDWAVTFPTKGFRVDNENAAGTVTAANIQASNNQWRYGTTGSVAADLGLNIAAGPFVQNIDANGAAVTIGITGFDREEKGEVATTGNTNPSPFPPGGVTTLALQGEANLITFGSDSALSGENFVLDFDVAATLGNNAPNGWSQLNFTAPGDTTKMLPTVGYAFKSRNQGDATLSFSQILGHAWK